LVSNCQNTPSSHTSRGDHGEAEARLEDPPHASLSLAAGSSDTSYGCLILPFSAMAKQVLLLSPMLAADANPQSERHNPVGANVPLRLPPEVTMSFGYFLLLM
jgi:hypothetical protein